MSQQRTFAFLDLAGFTTMTVAHGDADAADVAERFAHLARTELRTGEQLVKSIGDAVLLAAPDPASGLRLVARICDRADREPAFPILRGGLHHGPAEPRGEDWFGTAVNTAARIAARAAGEQVLASGAVAEVARDLGLTTRPLGATTLRGLPGTIELHEVVPCPPVSRVVDPVCRMALDPASATAQVVHGQHQHWFCSWRCAAAFTADPEAYPDVASDVSSLDAGGGVEGH